MRSLRLRGIDSRHLLYVDRAVLGMLQVVRPWTTLYPTSLPERAPTALLDALNERQLVSTENYEASGGRSEHRTYLTGEEAQIELHRRSFTVLWSAALPARGFLGRVRQLLAERDALARISTIDKHALELSPAQLIERVGKSPRSLTFIRLDFPDYALTWEAANLQRSLGRRPYLPGHVGVIAKHLDPEWLHQFILSTATPHVAADAEQLTDAAIKLTDGFTPKDR